MDSSGEMMSDELTPIQEHYLKKELINLQLHKEFNLLSVTYNDVTGLRKFGPPFAPYDPANPPLNYQESLLISMSFIEHYDMEFPFLRHFFNNFVITFPFIAQYQNQANGKNNDEQFWVNKIQKFYEIWKSKKISNSNDRGELSKRKLGLFKMIKFLLMLYNSSIPNTSDDLYQSLTEKADKNALKKLNKVLTMDDMHLTLDEVLNEPKYINGVELDIVGVRIGKELKKIRSLNNSIQYLNFWSNPKDIAIDKRFAKFYEFIIQIKFESTQETHYITRRYSEFQKLHHQLFSKFAGKNLPHLPSKIKQNSDIDFNSEESKLDSEEEEYYNDDEDDDESILSQNALNIEKDFANAMKISSPTRKKPSPNSLSQLFAPKESKSISSSQQDSKSSTLSVKLPREKLRLALRGYLHELLKNPSVRNSEIFINFIEHDKFTEITSQDDHNDISIRKRLDVLVLEQQILFQKETLKSIKELQQNMETLKLDVLKGSESDGILPIFKELESVSKIEELSKPLRSFIDLAKMEIAATLYELFLARDQSLELFKVLKKMHQFFPYRIVATIMRFTNPMAIMKKLIDLFLVQPPSFSGNGKSLLQYIFTLALNDDVKHLTKEIQTLKDNINKKNIRYGQFIKKIEAYMENKDDNLVILIKKNAARFNIDLVLSLLMNNNELPIKISDDLLVQLLESYRDFKKLEEFHAEEVGIDEHDNYNEISSKAELYTFLDDLFKATLRKKDKDNLRELWDEPELTKLIKELITIFFQPLIRIFTEAEIYLYIPIVKDFINELISMISAYQKNYSLILSGNGNIVVSFIQLLTKYENHMYTFIRNLYISDKNNPENKRVFTKLVEWFNSFVIFLKFVNNDRNDLKLDLNSLVSSLVASGLVSKPELIKEIDSIVRRIETKREMYKKMMEENPDLLSQESEGKQVNSKISANWNEINKNLSNVLNLNSGEIPIQTSDMDELNMELVDLETESKPDYLTKFSNLEFLNYTMEFEVNRRLGKVTDDIEFNDEDDGFENLMKDKQIKKLLPTFITQCYPILKDSSH